MRIKLEFVTVPIAIAAGFGLVVVDADAAVAAPAPTPVATPDPVPPPTLAPIVASDAVDLEWHVPEIGIVVPVGETAVDIARTYLGTPYVWGGEDPDGFDCSGLVQHVYAEIGIRLPRTTGELRYAGVVVDDPRPGDLVWSPGHIGIYSGNGNKIHAPHRGSVVMEVPLTNPDAVIFIRVT